MDPLTLRLEEETIENLSDEHEERGFRNRAVYIRWIIGQRDRLFEEEGAEIDVAERLADHDEQLSEHDGQIDDHDERLKALEEQARPFSWASRSSDSGP